jgi:hypothetical protein
VGSPARHTRLLGTVIRPSSVSIYPVLTLWQWQASQW